MSEKFKDVYLVIKHSYHPAKGAKTHVKDWAKNPGAMQVLEQPIITDRLSTKMIQSATFVINITQASMYKSRGTDLDNNEAMVQLIERYTNEIAQFYAKFRPQILEELVEQKQKLIAAEKKDSSAV